ncbi:MAG: GIY-YIG nuclease family protein, partial [Turicibacter sanguinis]
MAKYQSLDDIFSDVEFVSLLESVTKVKKEYLDPEIEQFKEINEFYRENNREPVKVNSLGKERTLYNR